MPARTFPSVDFPAPFSPISAWHSPRSIESETLSSAVTPVKVLVMFSNAIIAGRSLPEPLVPLLPVLFRVLLGDLRQRIDDALGLGIFAVHDFLEQDLDRLVAPPVAVLGVEGGDVALLDIRKLRRQSIDGDHLHAARLPF